MSQALSVRGDSRRRAAPGVTRSGSGDLHEYPVRPFAFKVSESLGDFHAAIRT